MDLEDIVTGSKPQYAYLCPVQRDKHPTISHVEVKKADFVEVENRVVLTGDWGQ